MANWIIIMAGGSGTRFWPASRAGRPKQFLTLGGAEALLTQTYNRVVDTVGPDHIVVVTAEAHAEHARISLPDLPAENLLLEPVGRNTAPCIGWATRWIQARDPEALCAVLPADHHISQNQLFRAHLEAAYRAAARDFIILFGIVPDAPETGYGYIERGTPLFAIDKHEVFTVRRFVEKPDIDTAAAYLADGRFWWNGGIFVYKASLMDAQIRHLLPELATGLDALEANPERLASIYPTLPAISIDYGVMEKTTLAAIMPARFSWSDLGSWDAAKQLSDKDPAGNAVRGDAILRNCRGVYVDAESGRFVAAIGVDDLVIVDRPDALLVMRSGASQEVKAIVDILRTKGRKELL